MRYYSIIILFIIACNGEKPPSLMSWSSEFIKGQADDDLSYFDNHKNVISKYFSVNYYEKRIVATTLMQMDCVDSIVGRIKVSHDTIFLICHVPTTEEEVCSELHKFKFTIRNPENIRYKIISTK